MRSSNKLIQYKDCTVFIKQRDISRQVEIILVIGRRFSSLGRHILAFPLETVTNPWITPVIGVIKIDAETMPHRVFIQIRPLC